VRVTSKLTERRRLTFKRAGTRRVTLNLTARGREVVASHLRRCAAMRVTAYTRARGYRERQTHTTGGRGAKLLAADSSGCAQPHDPGGPDPGVAPAGANDFKCRPSAAHPRPVVLAHGLGARAEDNWSYIAPIMHDAGYCVFTITYGRDERTKDWPYDPGGVIAMEKSSVQFKAFVDRVLAATGTTAVDIVGHSEGTVMPRWYLERLGGAAKVRRFVALTPLWRGTEIGGTAILRDTVAPFGLDKPAQDAVAGFCESCPEFLRGSDYLNDLNKDGEAVPGIEHTNIVTRYDELVTPYTSGIMSDGGTNITLQDVCPADPSEHLAVAFDAAVAQMVLNALDPAHAVPIPC
jgi:triacylglycerol lipase